jgi:hypothetical protein
MNFGQQQPQIEYQAGAESSSVLARTISNLSREMYGMAQSMAESAGEEFVANNQITEVELKAMRDGNTEVFKREFSLNAFKAAVRKFKSQELSAHLELEMSNEAAETQQAIELGRDKNGNAYTVDVNKIAETWQAKTKGYGDSLAAIDPSAAYKFRAAAAVNGNRLLLTATKAASEQNFLKNQVKMDASVRLYTNIVRDTITSKSDTLDAAQLQSELDYQRETIIGNALTLSGVAGQKYAIEKTAQIETDVKKAMFQNYVFSKGKGEIGDQVALEQKIRTNTLPPFLQKMWDGMSEPQRKAVRDGMAAEYQSLIKIKDDQRKLDVEQVKINANQFVLDFLEKSNTPDQRYIALVELEKISEKYPEIISASFLKVDLQKIFAQQEELTDNPMGEAQIADNLRKKSYATVVDVVKAAEAMNVPAAKALALAQTYLPKDPDKDLKEKNRLIAVAKIEHKLRTKEIKDFPTLENALENAKLTLADSSDFVRLLNEPASEVKIKTNIKDFLVLSDLIKDGTINSGIDLYNAAKGKVIDPNDLEKLDGQIVAKRQLINSKADAIANAAVDSVPSQNKRTRAQVRLDAEKFAKETYQRLLKDYKQKGFFIDSSGVEQRRLPEMEDTESFVMDNTQSNETKRYIESARSGLATNWGPSGAQLKIIAKTDNTKIKTSNLHNIRPTFLDDSNLTVDPVYIENLRRELRRIDIDPDSKAGQGAIDDIVGAQRSIERRLRKK